jgi:hypothetical protein
MWTTRTSPAYTNEPKSSTRPTIISVLDTVYISKDCATYKPHLYHVRSSKSTLASLAKMTPRANIFGCLTPSGRSKASTVLGNRVSSGLIYRVLQSWYKPTTRWMTSCSSISSLTVKTSSREFVNCRVIKTGYTGQSWDLLKMGAGIDDKTTS